MLSFLFCCNAFVLNPNICQNEGVKTSFDNANVLLSDGELKTVRAMVDMIAATFGSDAYVMHAAAVQCPLCEGGKVLKLNKLGEPANFFGVHLKRVHSEESAFWLERLNTFKTTKAVDELPPNRKNLLKPPLARGTKGTLTAAGFAAMKGVEEEVKSEEEAEGEGIMDEPGDGVADSWEVNDADVEDVEGGGVGENDMEDDDETAQEQDEGSTLYHLRSRASPTHGGPDTRASKRLKTSSDHPIPRSPSASPPIPCPPTPTKPDTRRQYDIRSGLTQGRATETKRAKAQKKKV